MRVERHLRTGADPIEQRRIDPAPPQHDLCGEPALETQRAQAAALGRAIDGPGDDLGQVAPAWPWRERAGQRARGNPAEPGQRRVAYQWCANRQQDGRLGEGEPLLPRKAAELGPESGLAVWHDHASSQNQGTSRSCRPQITTAWLSVTSNGSTGVTSVSNARTPGSIVS